MTAPRFKGRGHCKYFAVCGSVPQCRDCKGWEMYKVLAKSLKNATKCLPEKGIPCQEQQQQKD